VRKTILLILSLLLNSVSYAAVSGPYAVDAYTLHLYHFNGNASDAVTANAIHLSLINSATAADTSYSGFGTALNTYDNVANGTTSPAAAAAENIAVSNFVGSDGAFTFEAIIKPNVTLTQLATLNPMEIISGEGDVDTDRGWQFRITTAGQLEFNNLSVSSNDFLVFLPTTGDHAYAAGSWYHVAVTYSGTPSVAGNLKMYWTKLDSTAGQANLLGSFTMTGDIVSARAIDFVIGCDGRTIGGYNENFEGWIDEARVSSIARTANGMLIITDPGIPVIVTSPLNTAVREPQAAVFQTVFTSLTSPTVQWFRAALAGDIELTTANPDVTMDVSYNSGSQQYTATLTISNTATPDIGSYYCKVNNSSGISRSSTAAALLIQGLMAHWTLDQADFAAGQYLEAINGYDAAAQGTPTFAAGADGTANGAIQIAPGSGWATVTMTPSTTGQLTVSVWAYWQETSVSSDDLQIQSLPDGSLVTVNNGLKSNDHWQQVCAVFDGTTGKIYVDGKLQAQGACALPADMASLLDIGSTESGSESFNGALDDLRIYNYAMTNIEVADVYHAMSGLRVCLLTYASQFDYTGPAGQPDCMVDLYDLVVFANNWLVLYDYPEFADLSSNWLSSGLYPTGN
jgi:hypothetical protein